MQQFGRRQRNLRGADRVAAGIQQRAAEKIGPGERQPQGHARAAGKTADVHVLRIDAIALHHVVRRQQCERIASIQHVGVIARSGRGDEDRVVAIQHRNPFHRYPRIVPRRNEHQQRVTRRGRA